MPLFDQHLHSWHSFDCEEAPEQNVRAAIEQGLAGLTFTDHFDTHPTEWPLCRYDYDLLHEAVEALRDKYGGQLFIGHGIEICYQPERMDFIIDYLNSHTFDVVLLSVHWFGGRALHVRDHWAGLSPRAGTEAYLRTVLEAAEFAGTFARNGRRMFDILGHLDLVKRYTQRFFGEADVNLFRGLIDEILSASLAADLIPEINASTWRQGLDEPSPADWVVQRYAAMGGRCMSIGSDAHSAEHIGAGLRDAATMLLENGISALAIFRNRQRELLPLP